MYHNFKLAGINFRESFPEDYDSILNLINMVQPHIPWSRKYFEWQYLNNPAGNAKVWVVEHENKIIANYAAIPHYFKIRKLEAIAWRVQDVMTHPDYRGLGIMHRLTDLCNEACCTKESSICFTLPREDRATFNCFLRHGWLNAYRIPLWTVTGLPEKLKNIKANCASVKSISFFQKDVDELWNKSKNSFQYAVSRSSSYLTWRYLNRPGSRYFQFAEMDGKVLNGLLIMKYYDQDESHRVAHICDLFVTQGNKAGLDNLLIKALKFANEVDAEKLTAWLPLGHSYKHSYDSLGFVLDKTLAQWLVVSSQKGSHETAEVDKSENWHLSMGDSDVY